MRFTIPGEPCGKGRARTVNVQGRTMSYTPEKTVNFEALVRMEYQRQCKGQYIESGPVQMRMECYYGLAKSDSKRNRMRKLTGELRPTKKPDIDNCVKAVADALNGVAYKDDTQIVSLKIEKWYSEIPHVDVTIEEVRVCEE